MKLLDLNWVLSYGLGCGGDEGLGEAAAAAASADRSARKREAEYLLGAPQQMQRLGVRHFHRQRRAAQRAGLFDCVQQPQRTLTEKALAVLVVQIDPDDRTHNYHLRTKKLVVN